MKRLNKMHEDHFLKLFFTCFSLSFLLAAFFMPDRADMLGGLWRILNSPTKAATNFFSVGGYGRVVYFPGSDDDLRLYRPDRVWKFQCISYHLLAGITLYAGQEE